MVRLYKNERGIMNALLLPLIIVGLLLVGALAFAIYAFSGMQDYKNNSDEKSAAAVTAAVKVSDAKKEAAFAEASKSPLKTYSGPAAYGSLQVPYPKTWSAYVIEQAGSGASVDAYFNPNFVPSTNVTTNTFALRAKISNQAYASVLQTYQATIKNGKLTAVPYAFPKVPNTIGTRLTGEIQSGKQGSMVIVPLRDNTLQVWTEGSSAVTDFETYVLPGLSFSP